ncbi:MAG: alanine racemase [Clostridia bacterium]|nr:alanine racemase [Clostridia bacterium]MBQ7380366.1 alanine racemase [Clostridia bacterium]
MKHINQISPASVDNRRVWAHIDLDALVNNYIVSRDYIHAHNPNTPAIAVIKADAYGHGIEACARALFDCGCRHFAVACAEEGIAIRQALSETQGDQAEILILGYTNPAYASLLDEYKLVQTVFSPEYARDLHAAAKAAGVKIPVHVKVDTGMHRIGYPAFSPEEAAQTVEDICTLTDTCDAFDVRGLFTHLSDADCGNFCTEQWQRFLAIKQGLEQKGKCPPACHACNSPGCMRYPETYLDGVRVGALLFGVTPPIPPEVDRDPRCNLFPAERLRPVMQLQTRIIQTHKVAAGEPIGYGALYRADHDRTIATLSAGYADGWLRAYADTTVTVHTAQGDFTAPMVGRICMDLCMIDVTDLPCTPGDTVTLFGNDVQSLSSLAKHANTIAYEIPCLVTARVPRIYHP